MDWKIIDLIGHTNHVIFQKKKITLKTIKNFGCDPQGNKILFSFETMPKTSSVYQIFA